MANYQSVNERSVKLLRRLGFIAECYARDSLYIGGAWHDHVLTALTTELTPESEATIMGHDAMRTVIVGPVRAVQTHDEHPG